MADARGVCDPAWSLQFSDVKINAQQGWFRGLGDIVCFAWIGEGLLRAGQDVEFFATGWRAKLLKMFYMKTTEDPYNSVVPSVGYEQCLARKQPHNYLEWLAEQCGSKVPPHRPRWDPDPFQRELGRQGSAEVLIFPHAVPRPRTWPKPYFIELGMILKQQGIEVRMVTEKRDYDLTCFHEIFDAPWDYITGAVQSAKLVIGNDSGPAHLTGTLGTPTIAVMGMTTERIYGYLPEVIPFRKKNLPCSGCHGLYPYRRSCDTGCHDLYRTMPEDVAELAIRILRPNEEVPKNLVNTTESYSIVPKDDREAKNLCVATFMGREFVAGQSENGSPERYFYVRDATDDDIANLPKKESLVPA